MGLLTLSRRGFLMASAATATLGRSILAAHVNPAPLQPFPYGRTRLLPGPWRDMLERNRRYLHALDAARLLHTFRLNAGLPSSAEPLGGWEEPNVELRGHFLGHYLSACALLDASEGDPDLRRKASGMVAELAKCQQALGGGYLSAFPTEFLERLRSGKPVWAPWYTLHKIMAGLLDQHVLCGNEQALDVLLGMVTWTASWLKPLSDPEMQRILDVEHGGMVEVLCNLAAATGKDEHLALARRFEHRKVFDPLAEGRDNLTGLHANTNIPKIIGAARLYELTGERRYRDLSEFFWRQVALARSYVTGGTSNEEHWRKPPGNLAGELGKATQECCCTYNMLKLTRHLFAWTGSATYADYYERAFFNGILGTQNPEDGTLMYFVPLASGYWKLFGLPNHAFWCCTGTGIESFAKLADSVYFHGEDTLVVTQFAPAELDWREKGIRVRQETRFPHEPATRLVFDGASKELEILIRVPAWTAPGAGASLNGRKLEGFAAPGGYFALRRRWSPGDRLDVALPMNVRAETLPGDDSQVAFLYGPLVLAGRLGSEGLTRELQYGRPYRTPEDDWIQAIKGEPVPAASLEPGPRGLPELPQRASATQLDFLLPGSGGIRLMPLNELFGERYAVYWHVRRRGV